MIYMCTRWYFHYSVVLTFLILCGQVWDQLNVSGSGVGGRPLRDRAADARAALEEAQRDYEASRTSMEVGHLSENRKYTCSI